MLHTKKVINDSGSAITHALLDEAAAARTVKAMFRFPSGSVTAWQPAETTAVQIPLLVCDEDVWVKDIVIVPGQAVIADPAANVTLTISKRHAGASVVMTSIQTIAADVVPDTLAADTQYSFKSSVEGGVVQAGGAGTPFVPQEVAAGDTVTLNVAAAGAGRPLAGAAIVICYELRRDALVAEPRGLPAYKAFFTSVGR